MSKINTGSELLAALNDHPDNVINYILPKPDKKAANASAQFVNLSFNLAPTKKTAPGFFSFNNVPLSRGITAPEDIKPETKENFDCVRLQARIRSSEAGDFGQAMLKLEAAHKKGFDKLVADEKIELDRKQEYHNIVQTHYPEKMKKAPELSGKPKEDPLIKMKISFDKYSPKHPDNALKNRTKTVILDASKPFITPSGGKSFEEATVDGEPLNSQNIHKFLNKGAVIKTGIIYMSSLCGSGSWWSVPVIAHLLVVETGTGGEDPAADMLADLYDQVTANAQDAQPPANNPPAKQLTENPPAPSGDIEEILNAMNL